MNTNHTSRNIKCHRCKRKPPETTLNIEAVIHHKAKHYECINRKECGRVARRLK